MKPVCVPCQRFYQPHKNGIAFIEQMPIGSDAKPGTAEPHLWEPYKLWMGDLWKCRGCGAEIIVGAGFRPISEHYKPDFERDVEAWRATLKINDC